MQLRQNRNVGRNETRHDGDEEYEIPQAFRDALARWLDTVGNSRAQLAEKLGVHPTLISQIRTGTTKRSAYLPAICEYTGIPFPHPHLLLAAMAKEADASLPGFLDSKLAEVREMLRLLKKKHD